MVLSWLPLLWVLSIPLPPLRPDPATFRRIQPPLQFSPSLKQLEQQRIIRSSERRAKSRPTAIPQDVVWFRKACRDGALSRQECSSGLVPRSLGRYQSLQFPLMGRAAVTSGFGMRLHPIHGRWQMHSGRDFAAAAGSPVFAARSGVVIRSGWAGGYGITVELEHRSPRQRTLYAHLSETLVRPGDQVRLGERIGNVGSTGLSTGPHLHFELHQPTANGWRAVDPVALDRS